MKSALVLGAGGFIGSHLVKRLKQEGYKVIGVDLKKPEFSESAADHFFIGDLREFKTVKQAFIVLSNYTSADVDFHEVYQLAADMGGWLHVFSGEHDAEIVHNSAMINLNVAQAAADSGFEGKLFFASSACAYPQELQNLKDGDLGGKPLTFALKESDAFPANPDSPYGWEKLFSEIVYECFARNHGLNIRIARFHNIFGPEGTYQGGRQKAPADLCRQVAEQIDGGEIELYGTGEQLRSFLYIDECIEGVRRLMASDYTKPLNIGSNEVISINDLARMAMTIAGKHLRIRYKPSTAIGVQQRNSDNTLIKQVLDWAPSCKLFDGMEKTYAWVNEQVKTQNSTLKT